MRSFAGWTITRRARVGLACLAIVGLGCGCGDGSGDDDPGPPDAGGYPEVTTDHCEYATVPATANAGGTVVAAPLQAGAAEAALPIPIGTALGSYTARAGFLGTSGKVDTREIDISGGFNPSIGVHTQNMVKALALTAGDETVVIIKADQGYPSETHVFEIEQRLGPQFAGKVLLSVSHSHSAWGQHSAHTVIGGVGSGQTQQTTYQIYADTFVAVAQAAIAAQRPAKIGFYYNGDFDPMDRVNRDRRGANDELSGGPRDDNQLFVIRVDGTDDTTIAVLPVFGMHGTLQGEDNSFAHTDAPGGVERVLQERFDSTVTVMHLQGAGADVSPVGQGGLACDNEPGNEGDPCWDWLRAEGTGRAAVDELMVGYVAAGESMQTDIEIEMLTRSVDLGPDPATFTIRDGALSYAQFDFETEADQIVWSGDTLVSPIDEFNAPVGAGLCETEFPLFPIAAMPGVDGLAPYGSCVALDYAGPILSQILSLEFDVDIGQPACQSTRTTVSALRLGDYMLGTLPGEASTLIADVVRAKSPFAPDKTIVLGYAQGEMGYLLVPEDWVPGEYESSINFWGPLEGEYLVEQLAPLMEMAATSEREDGAAGGTDRFVAPAFTDNFTVDTTPNLAGTIPDAVPETVWTRTGPAAQAQPRTALSRVSGLAQFVWIGEDAMANTPQVRLQHEAVADSGVFTDVRRRSGRLVVDDDILLAYTPLPLRPDPGEERTHYWVAEWQAVPWLGSSADDSLDLIASVPTGRYRFAVTGDNYELFSNPWTVGSALLTVNASVAGTEVRADVTVRASKGFRLLDMSADSNGTVPLRNAVWDVELTLTGGSTLNFENVVATNGGRVTVDAGIDAGNVTSVRVADAFGNSGSGAP